MTETNPKAEDLHRIWTVGIVAAVLSLGALLGIGAREATGVAVGGLLAVSNLWAIGLLVRRLFSEDASALPWALFAVGKLAFLFGGLYLLVFFGLVDILPLVLGYGALPLGIVVAQLGGKRSADEQGSSSDA